MTARSSAKGTGPCLLALLLFCLSSDRVRVLGEPEPIPAELLYSESFINNAENLILLNKLNQVIEEKRTLDDVQLMIQSELESRAKDKARLLPEDYSAEELPTPNAMIGQAQRPGKRTAISYVTLCHFKICNMGRKRQLH